tara:strand:+ start:163 stop:825 length:663 start_codon:yes stop_codon:yes gene_type:complete
LVSDWGKELNRKILAGATASLSLWSFVSPIASAEDFRAECYQHYGNVLRGEPTDVEHDYDWKSEVGFDAAEHPASLIILDLPNRDFDWIDIDRAEVRTSRFYNGEENAFSVSETLGEIEVMGPQLSVTTVGTWGGEWTFELMGNRRAILRFLSATNTFDGVMIEIAHAECTLYGSHSILNRDQSSMSPAGYSEKFWEGATEAIMQHENPNEQELKSSREP